MRLIIGAQRRDAAKLAAREFVYTEMRFLADAEAGMDEEELDAFIGAVVDAAIDRLEEELA